MNDLVDLKRTKAERTKDKKEASLPSEGEDYPYGTSLYLDHDTLEKLGLPTPNVGDRFHVHGHAHVTSVSEGDREGSKKHRRVELQIRKMALQKHEQGKAGRVRGKDSDMADGAKAAMDSALGGSGDGGAGAEADSN